MLLTPNEARERGDASEEQRATLRRLLETKRYPLEWRNRFFADLRNPAGTGLTATTATSVIRWLEGQRDLNGASPLAAPEQVGRLLVLLRERIVPRPMARQIRDRIAAGTLTIDPAELYLADLERLPEWRTVRAAAHPDPTEGATSP